jgi:hypothetical protein
MISKQNLDKRICDIEGGDNTQTYREFIRESEYEFGLEEKYIDTMEESELIKYFEFLDYLWDK